MVDEQFEKIMRKLEEHDKKFEQIDKRFEAIDRRLDQMDKRFEAIDRKLDQMDKRFEEIDRRLDQMDKRFEEIDRRLDQINKQFEEIDQRFKQIDQKFKDQNKYILDLFQNIDSVVSGQIQSLEETCRNINQKTGSTIKSNLANEELLNNHEYRINRIENKVLEHFIAETKEQYGNI